MNGGTVVPGSQEYGTSDGRNTIIAIFAVQSVALEITEIENVSMTVTAPTAGMKVSDVNKKSSGVVQLGSNVPYDFSRNPLDHTDFDWQHNGRYMGSDDVFQSGETYELLFVLRTNDSTRDFTDNTTVTLSGDGSISYKAKGTDQEWTTLTIGVEIEVGSAHNITVVNGTSDKARAGRFASVFAF